MNNNAIALSAILGVSAPIVVDIATDRAAIAQPIGTFQNGTWLVTIDYDVNNVLTYDGYKKTTGDSISLRGVRVAGTPQRRLYIWDNNGYTYQVAWRPADPSFIRVQVFQPNGREILNELLSSNWDI